MKRGAISLHAVADVDLLLEVVLEREAEERAPVGGQLHRCAQAALDDGQVAGRAVEVGLGPVADRRQARAERLADEVLGVTDVDRTVPWSGSADGDV